MEFWKNIWHENPDVLGFSARSCILFVLGITAFRFLFVPTMGLMPQDAYYYFYSEHLSWSYYDHPPMIAWILKLFSVLGKAPWVVKFTAFTTTAVSMGAMGYLASLIWDSRKALLSVMVYSSTIMLSILSVISGPDVPLILFWTLSMIFLYKAIFLNQWWSWIVGGIFMGLAFDGKYTAIFLPFCLGLYLLASKKHRHYLLTFWPYLSVLSMLVAMTPVIYWNYIHDFASFGFQSSNRAQVIAEEGWKPEHILASIAQQSIVLIPVLFFLFIYRLPKYVVTNFWAVLSNPQILFLLSFFLPVFGAFMGLSVIYWVKLNWMMPAYIAGCLLTPLLMNQKWLKWQLGLSVLLHILVALQVWFYLVPIQSDDTWYGWDQLAEKVESISESHPEAFILAGDHYKTTAELMFYMDRKVYGQNAIAKHAVHFDYINDDLRALDGKDAIYIDSDPRFKHNQINQTIPKKIVPYFELCEEEEPIIIYRGTRAVRKFRVILCKNYDFYAVEKREQEIEFLDNQRRKDHPNSTN